MYRIEGSLKFSYPPSGSEYSNCFAHKNIFCPTAEAETPFDLNLLQMLCGNS